jgi:hypothetical protein
VTPPAASPESLAVQADALIHAELAEDYWTSARVLAALEDSGATVVQVAQAVALAGAAMLTEAAGGSSLAAERVAAGRYGRDAAAQARLVLAAADAA